ncbi:MAG: BMP family ABC transporter substrate-binding protein, partial [Rivularia sp. ALOHA_DT_140]|nr:BMP family ABC transporter substrate-binding protein [Rivularia sp. ALOHA_DT_140]
MERRDFLKYVALAGTSFSFASCTSNNNSRLNRETPTASSVATNEPLKVGFVYVGPVADFGWTYAHDLGRREMEASLIGKVTSTFVENVSEGADAQRVIRQLAADGNQLIFTTSFGYMNPTLKVAKDFPNVFFEHCTGYKRAPNVGTYLARFEEPRYLTGMIAGKMTKSNIIGFIGAYPIPEVIRGIGAFAQGLKSTNPQAKIKVVWVQSWYEPSLEREAAQALINLGADILTQHTNSAAPIQIAGEKGIYAFGYNTDMSKFSPKAHLTSAINIWGKYYTQRANDVINGRWKSQSVWDGLAQGMVDISTLNPVIPQDVQQLVNTKRQQFIDGTAHPFDGPVEDESGKIRVPQGQGFRDKEQLAMN